jgi:hypothetical protein
MAVTSWLIDKSRTCGSNSARRRTATNGAHILISAGGSPYADITVTPTGTIDYNPTLTFLSGRGTATLVVSQISHMASFAQSREGSPWLSDIATLVLLIIAVTAAPLRWRWARSTQA